MNVLVIPEDFRKDEHTLRPILRAMAAALARPGQHKLNVQVCTDPVLGGVTEVLKWERIQPIIDQYPMVEVFLICIDRDGLAGRVDSMNRIEEYARQYLGPNRVLLAENAWQEIEVWILAGCTDLPVDWHWRDIRAEIDLKECYFEPYIQQRNLAFSPGGGRQALATEAARQYPRIRQFCPEDIQNLERRLQNWIGENHG